MANTNKTFSQRLESLTDEALSELQRVIRGHYTKSQHSNNICIRVPKQNQIELENGRQLTEITSRNLMIDDCGYEYGIHILPISDMVEIIDAIIKFYDDMWICTDEDSNQFRLRADDVNGNVFTFKQDCNTLTIDISEYSFESKIDILSSYSYKPNADNIFIDCTNTIVGNEIIAECIFEYEIGY